MSRRGINCILGDKVGAVVSAVVSAVVAFAISSLFYVFTIGGNTTNIENIHKQLDDIKNQTSYLQKRLTSIDKNLSILCTALRYSNKEKIDYCNFAKTASIKLSPEQTELSAKYLATDPEAAKEFLIENKFSSEEISAIFTPKVQINKK